MAKSKYPAKPKTQPKRVRRIKPQITSIVVCDAILQQMPVGKPALTGIFDQITVSSQTTNFRAFSVWTKLFGGKGTYEVGLALETPDKTIQKSPGKEKVEFSPELIMQGAIVYEGMNVSVPGMYKMFVTLDGEPAGNPCPLRVIHLIEDNPENVNE